MQDIKKPDTNQTWVRHDSVPAETMPTWEIRRILAHGDDLMLVVDMAVYQYQNRDSNAGMPEWLRLRRRERWLKEGAKS